MFHSITQLILERMQHLEIIDAQDREDGTCNFIQLPNEPEYELIKSSENHFCLSISDLEITFCKNVLGEVERVLGVLGGVTYEGKGAVIGGSL